MGKSKIDWTDETINPFTGCRKGCRFCYARKMARRLAHIEGTVYQRVGRATAGSVCEFIYPTGGNHFAPAVHLDVLNREEGRLSRSVRHGCVGYPKSLSSRRVFIGSMGDMCYEGAAVTFSNIGDLLPMRAWWGSARLQERLAQFARSAHRHTILLLTKRPDLLVDGIDWPENVQIGVSLSTNNDLLRIEDLVRWRNRQPSNTSSRITLWASVEPLLDADFDEKHLAGLDWIVVGAQTGSGSGLRDFAGLQRYGEGAEMVEVNHGETILEAAERIVQWCSKGGIPCFVKDNVRRLTHRYRPPVEWPREFPRGVPA